MNKKIVYAGGILFIACLSMTFLWRLSSVLSVILLGLMYLKHRILPIKKELFWYFLTLICSTGVEILLVHFAGAWQYETKHIYGVPIWMPLFWGLLGTIIVVLYNGFSDEQ